MRNNQIKKLAEAESKINQHLYVITAMVTVITMAMILIEFFSRGSFLPANMNLFYLGVLGIYSLHKELVRWLGKVTVERQGEIFVYTWIILTVGLYIVNFLNNGYFLHSFENGQLTTLKDLSVLTVEVLGIFIFTRCLKILEYKFGR